MSEIMLYGVVGDEIDAMETVKAIKALGGKKGRIRLNTPGGIVWDGNAIAEAVKEHGNMDTHIDALAASMGSVVFLQGKRRTMSARSRLMIHNPASGVYGDAKTLRKEADVLEGVETDFAQFYADASGGKITKEEALQLMEEETWFTPEQAVALGFAHAITGTAVACAKIPATMQFRNIPKGLAMEDVTTTPAPKAGLLESLMAKIGGGTEVRAELDAAKAELTEAKDALIDAAAKITEAESRASEAVAALATAQAEHAAAIEALKAEHLAALEAAKIEGGQAIVAEVLQGSAPEALPHVETVEGAESTHTAKWNALRAAGKHDEAGAYYAMHKIAIFKGE